MRRPWFPLYVDDWRTSGKVKRMTNQERGCYVELMCYQWEEGFVPDDLKELANICGEPLPAMRRMWRRLEPCFPKGEDGTRRNPRIEEERAKAERISQQNTTNVGKRYAGRSQSSSDSVASPVSSTQVTGHKPQPTEQKPRLLPDENEKREPVPLHEAIATSPVLRRASP